MLPAYTDSRAFRDAFPECVAYGFFPQREMTLAEMWPLVHGKDERIDGGRRRVRGARVHGDRAGAARMSDRATAPLRLGGMALRNGLLVHGPTIGRPRCARADGSIRAASGRKPRVRGAASTALPGARGVRAPRRGDGRHPAGQARAAGGQAAVAGRARARRGGGRDGRRRAAAPAPRPAAPGGEAALAALSLLPSFLALRGGDLAAYHGVEHKAIGAYESGDDDARDATKEHDRCGSHLMAPLLASNVAGTALLKTVVEQPGPLAGAAVSLASIGARRRGLRLVRAPRRLAARPARCAAPATSSSACSAPASRPRPSSTSAARRWPRSCAPRA